MESLKTTSKTEQNGLFYFMLGAIALFFILHFGGVIVMSKYLLNNDIAYSFTYGQNLLLPKVFLGNWSGFSLLGAPQQLFLTPESFLLLITGAKFMMSWGFLLPLVILFGVSYLYFKKLAFHPLASLLGAFFTAFCPAYLTYLRVGHLSKLYLIAIVFMVFYFLNQLIFDKKTNVLAIFLFAFFIALGFLIGTTQTALYFCVWLPVYFLYFVVSSIKDYKKKETFKKIFKKTLLFALMVILSIALSAPRFLAQLKGGNVSNSNEIVESKLITPEEQIQKKAQNWSWATQWSNHPLEITELFAPGAWGFLSNNPQYPYWGKIGQTSDWLSHKGGFKNFSLTTGYLGIFIFIFAFYTLFFVNNRAKWFWLIMAVVNLLLNFGRYFPLYFLVYKLPFMDTMRNPNKFFMVFYFAMVMLSMYGLNHFIKALFSSGNYSQLSKAFTKKAKRSFNIFNGFILLIIIGLLVLRFIYQAPLENFLKDYQYSGRNIRVIFENISTFLLKGIFIYILALLPLYLVLYYEKAKEKIKSLAGTSLQNLARGLVVYLLIFGFVDLFLVNKKYLTPQDMPKTFPPDDPLAEILENKRKKAETYRLKFLGNDSYHQYFLYNQVQSRNLNIYDPIALRSGMPSDLSLLQQNASPLLAYNSLALNYFLSTRPLPPEIAILEDKINFAQGKTAYLYKNKSATPLVYFTTNTTLKKTTEDIAGFWKQTNLNLLSTSMVHTEQHLSSNDNSFENEIKIVNWENDHIQFKLKNNQPSTLVLANQYNPNWHLKMGDKTIKPFQINHFLNGYQLPANDTLQKASLFFHKDKKGNFYFAVSFYLALLSLITIYILKRYMHRLT